MIIQLCDQEEIMRVHDKGIAIPTAVEMCQDFGMNFKETVEKVSIKFTLSKESSQKQVMEYWKS